MLIPWARKRMDAILESSRGATNRRASAQAIDSFATRLGLSKAGSGLKGTVSLFTVVKKVLEKLQLPSDEPEVLFELFTPAKKVNPAEVSGETLLTVKDFISGALKVRGPPTGLDM